MILWAALAAEVPTMLLTVVLPPILSPQIPADFAWYIEAAQLMAQGDDPYSGWLENPSVDRSRVSGYIYPPLLAWAMQAALPHLQLPPISRHPDRFQQEVQYHRIVSGHWPQARLVTTVLVISQVACVGVFLLAMNLTLLTKSVDMSMFSACLCLGFFPLAQNFQWGQVNLHLLALGSVWYLAWTKGDSWLGGLALGLGVGIKLIQGPVLLLLPMARRWRTLMAGVLMIVATSLVAGPGLLWEYYSRVLPRLGSATGFIANSSPLGSLTRIADPRSTPAGHTAVPLEVRLAATLIGFAVLAASAVAIYRSRRPGPGSPRLEAALVLSAVPLVATLSWPAHLALELLPIGILLDWSLNSRQFRVAAAVLASWTILGPVDGALWGTTSDAMGPGLQLFMRVPELVPAGIWLLWAAGLWALRLAPAVDPAAG